MRTFKFDFQWVSVLTAALLLSLITPDGSLMAGTTGFSIDNSFEREQQTIVGDWNVIDTYHQSYSFKWGENFSSRFKLSLGFNVSINDVLRSLDVDTKTAIPSFNLSVNSNVWGLDFIIKDTIDYTNEFNTARKDGIEYGLDLDISPFYFPPLKLEAQKILDKQDGLEDKTEDKFDANIEYDFSDRLEMSLSWKEESTDDRLFDNNDEDSHEWEASFVYGQPLTSSTKVNLLTNWRGSRTDTLNNVGQILTSSEARSLQNSFKMNLDTFPNFTSELELKSLKGFVDDSSESSLDFSIHYDQYLVEIGTLAEDLTITQESVNNPTTDTDDVEIDLNFELFGTPNKYTVYSIQYALGLTNNEDGIGPVASKESQDDQFNLGFSIFPNEKVSMENAFNWSVTREDGAKVSSAKKYKIKGTFEGEMLNVPNLIFTPLLELNEEADLVDGTTTDNTLLELDFDYSFELPPSLTWRLTTKYTWEKSVVIARTLGFTSDFKLDLAKLNWDLEFEGSSSTAVSYDSSTPTTWDHTWKCVATRELTPVIDFEANYTYKYEGDDPNSDELEAELQWEYNSTFLSLSYLNERVFENPRDIMRVFNIEMSITF